MVLAAGGCSAAAAASAAGAAAAPALASVPSVPVPAPASLALAPAACSAPARLPGSVPAPAPAPVSPAVVVPAAAPLLLLLLLPPPPAQVPVAMPCANALASGAAGKSGTTAPQIIADVNAKFRLFHLNVNNLGAHLAQFEFFVKKSRWQIYFAFARRAIPDTNEQWANIRMQSIPRQLQGF